MRPVRFGRLLVVATVVLASWPVAVAPSSVAVTPSGDPTVLSAGQALTPYQSLKSPRGFFELDIYGGTMSILDDPAGRAAGSTGGLDIWNAGDFNAPNDPTSLVMQTDGNLVLYGGHSRVLWETRTNGTGSANYLSMQDDGNLVLRNAAGKALWAAGTGPAVLWNGQRLAPGGRLHVVAQRWPGLTYPPASLVMQTDGNLVWYGSHGQPLWSSRTRGTGSQNYAVMQSDGNFVVYTASGRAVWATGTRGSDTSSIFLYGTAVELIDLHQPLKIRWEVYANY